MPQLTSSEIPDDGHAPVLVGSLDESTILVGIVVTDADRVLLTATEELDAKLWYIPTGDINKGESIADAARRVFRSETALDLVDIRLIALENYPSLRSNFVRYTVKGRLVEGAELDAASSMWAPVDDVRSGTSIELISNDITGLMDKAAAHGIVPAIATSPIEYLLLQIGLVVEDHVLMLRSSPDVAWALPFTYPDYRSGETMSFAVQRLCAQRLKLLPEVMGVVSVEHGCVYDQRNEPIASAPHGSRLTFLLHPTQKDQTREQVDALLAGSYKPALWRWVSRADALALSANATTSATLVSLLDGDRIVQVVSV